MSRMKAVVINHEAPGHISVAEIEEPALLPNEALVRVAAVSLNQGEVRYAESSEPGAQIGWDLAGVVERAAADGSGPKEGARVVGFVSSGAWAELVAVPTNAIAQIPDNVSFEQAATLPVAGLTALYALEKGSGLLGRNVLITGANGGVGMFGCQLAKLMGAKSYGQVRREQYRDLVKSFGADEVIVSEDAGGAAQFGPFKHVLESVGGQVLSNSMIMLARDGMCVSFGNSSNRESCFNAWQFMGAGRASLYGFMLFNELGQEPASVGLSRLVNLVSEGKLKTHITVEESMDKAGEIAKDLMDRKIPGKAVLRGWI